MKFQFAIVSIFLSLGLFALPGARAQSNTVAVDLQMKAKMHQEIDYVGALYSSVYAPRSWKESHLGWNLAAEVSKAQGQLETAQNLFEARSAVANLIKSTKDYHVSFSFYSTEKASLPFQVKTVEGKSLIVFIDRTKLSPVSFPFAVGDELLTLGQVPVAQAVAELVEQMGPNAPDTDKALADLYLTRRSSARNFAVPHGPVTLSIKRQKDETVGTVSVSWDYIPEQLNNGGSNGLFKAEVNGLFDHKMISNIAQDLKFAAANPYGIGERNSFLPDFGTRTWASAADSDFDAYIFKNEQNQSIGVIRIPVYEAPDDNYAKAVSDFSAIIQKMQAETSGLIIDQNNNPGGSVFYLYALVSMLSDQTMKVPAHRVSLLPDQVRECLKAIESLRDVKSDDEAKAILGNDLSGYPATYELAVSTRDYCATVVRQFHEGKHLSSPLHLWGVDQVNPNPVHYTKPIVLLTNMLDFSGGDFFPAILQDNKRVTIVGTRTAGAGGFILEASFPNSLGIEKISFTGSIAERADNNPIENLGVSPDVVLPMTAADLRNGFVDYESKVKAVLGTLVK